MFVLNELLFYRGFGVDERNDVLDKFNRNCFDILIATKLVSRGVDFHAHHVINFDLPLDYNEYVHRCGRVGRAGKIGYVHTFIDLDNQEDCLPEVVLKIGNSVKEKIQNGIYNRSEIPRVFLNWIFENCN